MPEIPMTFSIVAHDVATGQVGIAVASRTLATGARVPHIRTGAIASQARVNRRYGPRGLALLASGAAAADTVRLLVATDEEQEVRQLHLMDRMGRFAAHTGAKCEEWCGHLVKETYSVAGNILTGAHVLEAMAAAYEAGGELPLAQRLLAVMQAAEQADGDKRGKQSAALLIHGNEDWALLDLRIDDHADPLSELGRLEQLARSA
jgi:uncharacterized Ntn-hydrolase superfamily protein